MLHRQSDRLMTARGSVDKGISMSSGRHRVSQAAGYAMMALPPWLRRGDFQALANDCRWRMEPPTVAEPGLWRVALAERSTGSAPKLLEINRLANAKNIASAGAFSRLRRLREDIEAPHDTPKLVLAARDYISRLEQELDRDLRAWAHLVNLRVRLARPAELAREVRTALADLLRIHPASSVHLLQQNPALHWRIFTIRVLLLVQDDDRLADDPKALAGGSAVESAKKLIIDSSVGMSCYLVPALLSNSPFATGFSVPRAGGALVFDFGDIVGATPDRYPDLLGLFTPMSPGIDLPLVAQAPTPAEIEATLRWWVRQLDILFMEVTDPANSVASDGTFDARRAFSVLLSVEQAFRNVQGILAHEADSYTTRMLCFDTLDTLEGLRQLDFGSMCDPELAKRTLSDLESSIPDAPKKLLLPRAVRAVEGLRRTGDGFFLPSRLTKDGVVLPTKNGREETVSHGKATALYLRMLRNAGHGFGGKHDRGRSRDEALLASHNGSLPSALPDLAYLYLLRLVANPHRLRIRSATRSEQGTGDDGSDGGSS